MYCHVSIPRDLCTPDMHPRDLLGTFTVLSKIIATLSFLPSAIWINVPGSGGGGVDQKVVGRKQSTPTRPKEGAGGILTCGLGTTPDPSGRLVGHRGVLNPVNCPNFRAASLWGRNSSNMQPERAGLAYRTWQAQRRGNIAGEYVPRDAQLQAPRLESGVTSAYYSTTV